MLSSAGMRGKPARKSSGGHQADEARTPGSNGAHWWTSGRLLFGRRSAVVGNRTASMSSHGGAVKSWVSSLDVSWFLCTSAPDPNRRVRKPTCF